MANLLTVMSINMTKALWCSLRSQGLLLFWWVALIIWGGYFYYLISLLWPPSRRGVKGFFCIYALRAEWTRSSCGQRKNLKVLAHIFLVVYPIHFFSVYNC